MRCDFSLARTVFAASLLFIPIVLSVLAPENAGAQATTGTLSKRDQLFISWEPTFHQTWLADSCVQRQQSWDDYLDWVKNFYYQFNGWFTTVDAIAARVTNGTARAKITSELTTLGRRVAGEWSKDNSCRKIDTFSSSGIQHFAAVLRDGLSRETGDGTSVQTAIIYVKTEVDQLLAAQ